MKNKFKVTIHITLVTVFIMATALTGIIAIGLQYYFSQSMALEYAEKTFQQSATDIRDYLTTQDRQATQLTKVLAKDAANISYIEASDSHYQLFAQVMQNNPMYYSIYMAYENGDFLQLINLNASSSVKQRFNASLRDRWLKVEINTQQKQKTLTYLDKYFKPRYIRQMSIDFNPIERTWYREAKESRVYKSAPYQFSSLQAPGVTYAIKTANNHAVLGVDIALSTIAQQLTYRKHYDNSEVYLFQAEGQVIAKSNQAENSDVLLRVKPLELSIEQQAVIDKYKQVQISNSRDWMPIDFSISGEPRGYAVDITQLVSQMTGLEFNYTNGLSWPELVERYKLGELVSLQAVYDTPENNQMGELSAPWLSLPFSIAVRQNQSTISSLNMLAGKRLAIPLGWSITPEIKKAHPSINIIEYATPLDAIKAVQFGQADAALDTRLMLQSMVKQYFIEGVQVVDKFDYSELELPESLHFLVKPSHRELIPIINLALSNITPMQQQFLRQKWLDNQADKQLNQFNTVPYKVLIQGANNQHMHDRILEQTLNQQEKLVYVSSVGRNGLSNMYFSVITPSENIYQSGNDKVMTSIFITAVCLVLLAPLSFYFAALIERPIRRIMEENDKIKTRNYSQIKTRHSMIKELDELAISLSEMAESIQSHERDQKQLMESFIELIAGAIDDKSPYTAGHCQRVPELGIMLTELASEADYGIFKDYKITSEEQRREFRIAAWLHDCGKVTTPEHIVDKGTKLETIYNRIHEIRMRFEVLLRDAEIKYLKQTAQRPESDALFKQDFINTKAKLVDDFSFIATMNIGGEFVSESNLARLNALAKITWQRHFDDNLGLSPVEQVQVKTNDTLLPVREYLLSDKPQHIKTRAKPIQYEARFGIKMTPTEYEYNRGELYNLSIARGTLTAEDRFKINEHIISTIKMLDNLPFPPELANVPRYASTHHETLIGTGYPRQLTADDLSVPERILVLADIFEALTAADRPYKKAKTLSQALQIMHSMVRQQHIDRDVFELFLTSGAYRRYATLFLEDAQIDEPDIDVFLQDKIAV